MKYAKPLWENYKTELRKGHKHERQARYIDFSWTEKLSIMNQSILLQIIE